MDTRIYGYLEYIDILSDLGRIWVEVSGSGFSEQWQSDPHWGRDK